MIVRIIIALLFSSIIVFIISPSFVKFLKHKKIGQTMYELGPQSHMYKQGTPIMGGFLFIFVTVLSSLVLHKGSFSLNNDFTIALLLVSLLSMFIGFCDDYIKAVKHRNLGLTGWQKIAGQVIISALFTYYCYQNPNVGSSIYIPFVNTSFDLGIFYIPIMMLLLIFIVNSANIQDGMDGLLSSVTAIGFTAWGLIAVNLAIAFSVIKNTAMSAAYINLAVFSFALVGGTIGFLRVNYYPAKTFMGDTGSMFIGGATIGIAMLMKQPILLLFIAFTPIMSSVSVIMQRGYYKITHGKRIFKMSPIHHHFEKCGIPETKVVTMYTGITLLLSIIAVLSVCTLVL